MAFVFLFEAARRHRRRVTEELRCFGPVGSKSFTQKLKLTTEHLLQPLATDIGGDFTVDFVRDRHVVGRHGFGDGSGGSSSREELTGHFLASTNLYEGAVLGFIQIDLQCLLL